MSSEVKDECGVAAVYLPKGVDKSLAGGSVFFLYKMLLQMQNRGQLSAGITTYNKDRALILDTYKKLGSVNEVFHYRVKPKMKGVFRKFEGDRGIGHTRYATFGSDRTECAQPFERKHGRTWKWFSLAFNGNLANFSDLKKDLEKGNYHLSLGLDTEIIMHYLSKAFVGSDKKDLKDVFTEISEKFDGAYNIVYINAEGSIIALRDPIGIRPLSYIKNDEIVAAASESVALQNYSDNGISPIKPGEMLLIENGDISVERYAKNKKTAHCMFEWVYFSNAASILDGRGVYETRYDLGKELARNESLDVNSDEYVVVGVPDSSKPSADGYAHELGLRSMEGLIRNRYIGRTFIESSGRYSLVKDKFMLNKTILRDKKIILVDDSVVRGISIKAIIDRIRKDGKAKEIHVRVSCPPIKSPCFYGIDMTTMNELIACNHANKEDLKDTGLEDLPEKTIERIRKEIGADTLHYQTIKGLVKSIGLPENKLCLACITGRYPTECGRKLACKAFECLGKKEGKRTYE